MQPSTLNTTISPARDGVSLPSFLQEAGQRVGALGAEFEADRGRLDGLRRRLGEERCHLAVIGQFNRGKSTLVNALLLAAAVLPASVVPLTSIPTFLHGGEQLSARVQFDNGRAEERFSGPDAAALAEFLARFVTESANPHNRLGVRLVEATYPHSAGERCGVDRHAGHRLDFPPQYRGHGQFPSAMRCGPFCRLGRPSDHRSRGGVPQARASQSWLEYSSF